MPYSSLINLSFSGSIVNLLILLFLTSISLKCKFFEIPNPVAFEKASLAANLFEKKFDLFFSLQESFNSCQELKLSP